jgi:hypothetical protein
MNEYRSAGAASTPAATRSVGSNCLEAEGLEHARGPGTPKGVGITNGSARRARNAPPFRLPACQPVAPDLSGRVLAGNPDTTLPCLPAARLRSNAASARQRERRVNRNTKLPAVDPGWQPRRRTGRTSRASTKPMAAHPGTTAAGCPPSGVPDPAAMAGHINRTARLRRTPTARCRGSAQGRWGAGSSAARPVTALSSINGR